MILDADDLDAAQTYKLFIATVVPRAIGWVSTLSKAGIANLAPFSFFTVVGRKPPLVSISMQKKSDGTTLKRWSTTSSPPRSIPASSRRSSASECTVWTGKPPTILPSPRRNGLPRAA